MNLSYVAVFSSCLVHVLAGVMQMLRPLLLDVVPTVQQTAAVALGRLANYNDDLAEAVVKGDILPQLVYSLAEQNVSCKLNNSSVHFAAQNLYALSIYASCPVKNFNG